MAYTYSLSPVEVMRWRWTNYLLWFNRCARAELERRTTDAEQKRVLALLSGQYAALAMWDPSKLAEEVTPVTPETKKAAAAAALARAREISTVVKQGYKVVETIH